MVADRIQAKVGGHAQRRGLIPRTPAAERVLADAAVWLAGEYPDALRSTRQRTLTSGDVELAIDLHPAAPRLLMTASDTGRISVVGETAEAGPGYHRFVGRVLERMATDVGIEWTDGDGALTFADRSATERAYLAWLGPRLTRARVLAARAERGIHLGMPAGAHMTTEAVLATVLGPRDAAWLDAAIADPRVAIEITPWWADAPDGRYLLNRAQILMWLEVRWRAPAVEGEADLLDEIHRTLSRAYPMDPSLAYPWHAWAELAFFRGIDDQMSREAARRASLTPEPAALVGYRRGPVRVTHEGWSLEIPGAYAERRTADEWWAGGAGRSITLAATRTGLTDGTPMPAQAFVAQFGAELGPDALSHRDGEVFGRARLTTDATSGLEIGVLEGYSAIRGSGAAVRIEFDDPNAWQWALDTWRALRPA